MSFGTSTNKTYVQIKGGKLLIKAKEATPDTVEIKKKDGSSAGHYHSYPNFTGYVKKLSTREREYQGNKYTELSIDMVSDNSQDPKVYQFDVNVESSNFRSFAQFFLNCNPSKKVTIQPLEKEKIVDGKTKVERSLFVMQEGVKLGYKYKKEELPEVKVHDVKGKKIYDDGARIAFLLNKLNEHMATVVPGIDPAPEEPHFEPDIVEESSDVVDFDASDDLPF